MTEVAGQSICARCKRHLTKGFDHDGQTYGSTCIKRVQEMDSMFSGRNDRSYRSAPPGYIMGYVDQGHAVVVDDTGTEIEPHLDEVNHSPTGYQWGYLGSGPAQLSYAICRLFLEPEDAQRVYQAYKFSRIAKLGAGRWQMERIECDKEIQLLLKRVKDRTWVK